MYVVFDSGVMVKLQVYEALRRLKGFLESCGAEVWVIHLPHDKDGKNQGADDYPVAEQSIDDLLAQVTTELGEPPRDDEDEEPAVRYRENPHRIVWSKPTLHRTCPTPLTSTWARSWPTASREKPSMTPSDAMPGAVAPRPRCCYCARPPPQ